MKDGKKEVVYIDTEDIANFLFRELIVRGLAPAEDELKEIADAVFEYLVVMQIIDEEVD